MVYRILDDLTINQVKASLAEIKAIPGSQMRLGTAVTLSNVGEYFFVPGSGLPEDNFSVITLDDNSGQFLAKTLFNFSNAIALRNFNIGYQTTNTADSLLLLNYPILTEYVINTTSLIPTVVRLPDFSSNEAPRAGFKFRITNASASTNSLSISDGIGGTLVTNMPPGLSANITVTENTSAGSFLISFNGYGRLDLPMTGAVSNANYQVTYSLSDGILNILFDPFTDTAAVSGVSDLAPLPEFFRPSSEVINVIPTQSSNAGFTSGSARCGTDGIIVIRPTVSPSGTFVAGQTGGVLGGSLFITLD